MMRRSLLFIFILVVLLAGTTSLLAQPAMTVTEDNLLALIRSNAPEKLVIKAVSMAGKIDVDTSLEGTVALMGKGVSEEVVNALVRRKEQLTSRQPATLTPVSAQAVALAPTGSTPEEAGVFIETPNGLVSLKSESIETKGPSAFGIIKSGGGLVGGLKVSGILDNPRSPVQLSGRVVIIARILEGESIDDACQLVSLETKKNRRELTTARTGFMKGTSFGPKAGGFGIGTGVEFKKIAPNTYRTVMDLPSGEYGVLVARQSQRLYTFGVYPLVSTN